MKQQRHSSASSSSDQGSQSVLGHLMQAYWEVRAFYEKKKIGNEGLKAFKKARIEALKPPLAVQPLEITPLVLRELKPIKDRPMAALKRADANGTVSSKCPIIPLEHLEATPSMQYWTHTEVNINAEDEFTLSHIPFLGDAEDDTSFCADLMKTFPDGIHGTVNGCGEYINDYILAITPMTRSGHAYIQTKYVNYVLPLEEADWYGLELNTACRKLQDREDATRAEPMKYAFEQQLIAELRENP
uniref:SMI1_KNR4 domain-containing protein n=1 Tax=Globodera pallida TaxID=36090 RepID=A0A183BJI1_GLOPA